MEKVDLKENLQCQLNNLIAILQSINDPDIKLMLFEEQKECLITLLNHLNDELKKLTDQMYQEMQFTEATK